MPLKITKSIEPITVNSITMCLYSVPGIGKTSIAFTADRTLLLDFDHGSHRSKNRGDTVKVERWSDVVTISAEDLAGYKTIAVDTAGRALDILSQKIIDEDPKMGRGGALTLQGYGRLKVEFTAWVKRLMSFGLDVVLLCHSDESKHDDELVERLDMQGGSKNEVYKISDVMGRLYMHKGKRCLNFSPTDVAFGKNPASLPVITVPDFAKEQAFLSTVIDDVKAAFNTLSKAQAAAAAIQDDWREMFAKVEAPEDLTALIEPASKLPAGVRDSIRAMMAKTAADLGWHYSKESKQFEPKAA